jgi:hypothetical protein
MIFGQPRQDDLLHYLLARLSGEELSAIMDDRAPRDSRSLCRSPTRPLPLLPMAMESRYRDRSPGL